MVTVMLEPAGDTTIWNEDNENALFDDVTGQFHRVSFALNGIVCALEVGSYMITAEPTEVRVDGTFIALLDQRRKWRLFPNVKP